MPEWQVLLSPELLQAAYKGGNELAWPKKDALRVVRVLTANAYTIDGVDVWIPTHPGPTIPTPFVYDWMAGKTPRTDKDPNDAAEFIKTFSWDPADRSHKNFDPVFNISAHRK